MAVVLKRFIVLMVVLAATTRGAGAYCDYETKEKVEKLGEETQEIKYKLDEMSEKIDKMFKFTEKVELAFCTLNNCSDLYEKPANDSISNMELAGVLPITLLEARREPLGDGEIRYVVRYVKNEELTYLCLISPDHYSVPEVVEMEGNIEEASVIETSGKSDRDNKRGWLRFVVFKFYSKNMSTGLSITLGSGEYGVLGHIISEESTPDENATVVTADALNVYKLAIDAPLELVYEAGQDVQAEITLLDKNHSDFMHYNPVRIEQSFLYDLDLREFIEYLPQNMTEMGNMENTTAGLEFNTTFKTSERKVCGTVEFFVDDSVYMSIVKSVSVMKTVYIRPSDLDRPFPEDLIGFVEPYEYNYVGKDDDGTEINLCDAEADNCSVHCIAAGGNIFGVTMQRVLPDGNLQHVQAVKRWRGNYKFLQPLDYRFPPPPRDQLEEPYRFRCSATAFDGSTASRDILVHLSIYPVILENRTSVQITKNGSVNTLEVECSATGIPLPNITFNFYLSEGNLEESPDDISVSQDGFLVTARKIITWSETSPDSGRKNHLYSVSCLAQTLYTSDYQEIKLPNST